MQTQEMQKDEGSFLLCLFPLTCISRYTKALICFLLMWYLTASFKDTSSGVDNRSTSILRKSLCVQRNHRQFKARA